MRHATTILQNWLFFIMAGLLTLLVLHGCSSGHKEGAHLKEMRALLLSQQERVTQTWDRI
ncbi:MAG: hypothetical protein CMF59_19595 [Leptospiraceae bacterium]|nr:hypothetical protein [Leptospiraceae bacterium]